MVTLYLVTFPVTSDSELQEKKMLPTPNGVSTVSTTTHTFIYLKLKEIWHENEYFNFKKPSMLMQGHVDMLLKVLLKTVVSNSWTPTECAAQSSFRILI